ncbi:MAG: hypothetical protein VYE22_00095 [Myxococcota bacterium]|nr:hypothetical protein [Myxococcota bacterium]
MKTPSRRGCGGRATRAGSLALAVAGGALGAVIVDLLLGSSPRVTAALGSSGLLVAAGLSIAGLFALALTRGIRKPAQDSRLGWRVRMHLVANCALAGWLTAPVTCTLLLAGHAPDRWLEALVTGWVSGLVLGLFVGAPLGALYGLGCAYAGPELHLARRRPTLASPSRVGWAVGLTVAVAGGAVAGVCLLAGRPPWLALGVAWAGLLAAAWAQHARSRLAALARTPSGWARCPRAALPCGLDELMPLHERVPEDAEGVLVRVEDAEVGAYRSAVIRRPWALIE